MDSQLGRFDQTQRLDLLEKKQLEYEKKLNRLETIKVYSTFISSVVLAGAGILVTLIFNSKELKVSTAQADAQLKVSREQSNAQITISRNKELAAIIPNLGAEDSKTRKFAAISLALYGKDAVQLLVAALSDPDIGVAEGAETSLIIIGDNASEELIKVFNDEKSGDNTKGRILYVLDATKNAQALPLATSALKDVKKVFLCTNAVQVIGSQKDRQSTAKLIEMLKKRNYLDIGLARNIVWALGEISDGAAEESLKNLLNDQDETIRVATIWAYAKVARDRSIEALREVIKKDSSEKVKIAAEDAIRWLATGSA